MPDFTEILKANSEQVRKDRAIREQHVEELRTANLIAMLSVMAEFYALDRADCIKVRNNLEGQIWERLGLKD